MARIVPTRRPFKTSSEQLGRVKLQASVSAPTSPPPLARPTRVRRPPTPHRASIRDYLR